MMVPQAYRHATTPPMPRSTMAREGSVVRSSHLNNAPKQSEETKGRPKMLSSISAPSPSKPVIIPTKTQTPRSRRSRPDDASSKAVTSSSPHDATAMPPSMAALLAVASLPSASSFTLRRSRSGRNIRKESLCLDDFRHTLSSSSPKSWSILQGPPEEGEEENKDREGDSWSIASGSTAAPLSSYRSLSTDSMPSLDMESDLESPGSPGPLTPASRMRAHIRREKRLFHQLSVSDTDHPLSPLARRDPSSPAVFDAGSSSESLPLTPTMTPKTNPRSSSFKSNLTASIRLLKSAARSLSEIAPKSYVPDPIPRPSPLATTQCPEPQPRSDSGSNQALMPVSAHPPIRNIDALPFHLHLASPLPSLPPSTASIQLMPYIRSTVPGSATATAPPVFLPAANPILEELERKRSSPRSREPRENSDFLRVVVLEMNMRRLNKLGGEGRARIWLAPRVEEEAEEGSVLAAAVVDGSDESRLTKERGVDDGDAGPVPAEARREVVSAHPTRPRTRLHGTKAKRVPTRWVGVTP